MSYDFDAEVECVIDRTGQSFAVSFEGAEYG